MAIPVKPLTGTLPRFATSGDVIEPSTGRKDSGWLGDPDIPPHETFNWLHVESYNWLVWLDTISSYFIFGDDVTKEISFPGPVNFLNTIALNEVNVNTLNVNKELKKPFNYLTNFGRGWYFDSGRTYQPGEDLEFKDIEFGFSYESIRNNRSDITKVSGIAIEPQSPEIDFTGAWSNTFSTAFVFGNSADSTTQGDSFTYEFLGVSTRLGVFGNIGSDSLVGIFKAEISDDGGSTFFDEITLSTRLASSETGNHTTLFDGLKEKEYFVRVTIVEGGMRLFDVAYYTHLVEKTALNSYDNRLRITAVNAGGDFITLYEDHQLLESDKVRYENDVSAGETIIGGLTLGNEFFVRNPGTNTVQLSLTDGGAIIDISNGAGWLLPVLAVNRPVTVSEAAFGTMFGYDSDSGRAIGTPFSETNSWNRSSVGFQNQRDQWEFKYKGSEVWVNIKILAGVTQTMGFEIDGVTTNVRNANYTIQTTSTASTGGPTYRLRVDDGNLKHGIHTVKITQTNNSGTGEFLISGYAIFPKPIFNELVPADINDGTNTIVIPGPNHDFNNDEIVVFDSISGTLPGGLVQDQEVFIVNSTGTTVQVSLTKGGGVIDITTTGTGIFNIEKVRMPTERACIVGQESFAIGIEESIFNRVGTWTAITDILTLYRQKRSATSTNGDTLETTTPNVNGIKAIYFISNKHFTDYGLIKATLAGGPTRLLQQRISNSVITTFIDNVIEPLYFSEIDGDLANKALVLEHLTGTSMVPGGIIYQIGDDFFLDKAAATPSIRNFSRAEDSNTNNGISIISDCYGLSMYGLNKDEGSPTRPYIETQFYSINAASPNKFYNLGIPLITSRMNIKFQGVFPDRNKAVANSGSQLISMGAGDYPGLVNVDGTATAAGWLRIDLDRAI